MQAAQALRKSSLRRGARGASLVEFALILPVFVMLLFGMISAGFALNEKQQITHATREGARYAATVPSDQTFADTTKTWAEHMQGLIVERSAGTLEAADVCVSLVTGSPGVVFDGDPEYSTDGTSPCIPNQAYPDLSINNGQRVQVTATKPATIELVVFGSYTVTMEAEATALSEPES